jgi:hypothetical protein
VNGGALGGPATWYDVDADFIMTSSPTINASGDLEIRPAVTLKFDHATRLYVYGNLDIPGTASDGVLMTRRDPADEWFGLEFSSAGGGTLEYCTIEHATRYDGIAIYDNGSSGLHLDHCLLHENDYGLYVRDASPSLVNCQIINNNLYGIYMTGACIPIFGGSLSEWNDIYGNGGGLPDRDFCNGSEDISVPYVFWGETNHSLIEDLIHHRHDDPALGYVNLNPWTNSAHDTEYNGPTPVDDQSETQLPSVFRLGQNYPNPFNPATTISYDLPTDSHVELTVLDVAGRRLATLVDGPEKAGFKTVQWETRSLGSGIYLYRLRAGDFEQIRKMTLVR